MKEKMKNLLKNKIFMGSAATVLVLAITITTILLLPDKKATLPTGGESSTTESTVNPPEINQPEASEDTTPSETESIPTDLNVDVDGDNDKTENGNKDNSAKKPDNPVAPKEPEQPKQPDADGDGGINIGGGGKPEKYNCNTANHHCESEQAHAWLKNQELEGCEMCGSHSCPSFYDINQWGFTKWNPQKCPKYNEKVDPIKNCQRCGREMWSKDNPTGCFSFLQPTDCECGQHVEGNTCHHH